MGIFVHEKSLNCVLEREPAEQEDRLVDASRLLHDFPFRVRLRQDARSAPPAVHLGGLFVQVLRGQQPGMTSRPIRALVNAQPRWVAEPAPAEANFIVSWFAFAYEMNSCKLFAGKSLRATITSDSSAISTTGAKSVAEL
jgi:hypothetical protein